MQVHRLASIVLLLSFVARAPAQRPGDFDFDSLPEKTPTAEFVARLFEHAKRGPVSTAMAELAAARLSVSNETSFVFLARRIADPAFLADIDRVFEEVEHRKATPLELAEAAVESGKELFEPFLVRQRLKSGKAGRPVLLEGRVVDSHDRPVGEAIVTEVQRDRFVRTDEKGVFRLDRLNDGNVIWLAAWREGECCAIHPLSAPPVGAPVVLKLEPEVPLVGKVLDAKGATIENCGLTLYVTVRGSNQAAPPAVPVFNGGGGSSIVDSATDVNGVFRLLHQPAGAEVTLLRVNHPKFLPKTVQRPAFNLPEKPVEIRLDPGCEISGHVVDESGKPIANAVVKRKRNQNFAESVHLTGASGEFSFGDCAPGECTITAEHRSLARGFAKAVADLQKPVADLKIVMKPGDTIEGTVVHGNGKPAVGVYIGPLVHGDAKGYQGNSDVLAIRGAYSDDNGAFKIGPLPADEEFRIFVNGSQTVTARPGERELQIRMP